ncbi:RNA polymerase sigma factor [Stieleria varia]|uniref:ECF RNA polymerase sigma factor SigW n=1 Tax=Stieleria varia TaxID=2528005 RepID=A0A5C5ZYV2_9BACT|nr:RNA polymerase sigma factor [Stieleria varia]TWT92794.1 ECF RNA polymerase sigma factor SigW [Stieleria varia]
MPPPDEHLSDEHLVDRWRQHNDQSAIAELAERYLERFYATARAMTLRCTQAEDVAQETMLKIVRSIGSFDSRKSFRTWSYTILLNTVRSHQRRSSIRSQRTDASVDVGQIAIHQHTLETQLVENETRQKIQQELANLSDKQRTAIVLTLMDGLAAAAVAEMENCSVDAIYQRVAEARKTLRNAPSLKQFWQDDR